MFAVIKTGGKQYRVQEGDVLDVEKLNMEKDQKVTFDKVLLVEDEGETLIGTPFVEKALVRAEVIENFKDKKVIVFKKKRRKQYRRKSGHRQELTRIKIEEIVHGEKAAPRKKPAEAAKIEKEKRAPRETQVVSEEKAKKAKEERPEREEKEKEVMKESKAQGKTKVLKAEKLKDKAPSKKKTAAKTAAKTAKTALKKEK